MAHLHGRETRRRGPRVSDSEKALAWLHANADEESAELRRFAARCVADPGTVDDAVQQAFANALAFLQRGGKIRNCKSFLRALVLHEIRRGFRRCQRWREFLRSTAVQILAADEAACDADEAAEAEQQCRNLRALLKKHQNDPGFLILVLRMQKLSYSEIAKQVQLPPTACRVRAARARARLKKLLSKSA